MSELLDAYGAADRTRRGPTAGKESAVAMQALRDFLGAGKPVRAVARSDARRVLAGEDDPHVRRRGFTNDELVKLFARLPRLRKEAQ